MQTISLQIQNHAFPKFLNMLKQFDEGEVKLIPTSTRQAQLIEELEELERIKNGSADLMVWEDFSAELDEIIDEYENKSHS